MFNLITARNTHFVGLLLTRNRLVAETSAWQHITLTGKRHPCLWRNSNL